VGVLFVFLLHVQENVFSSKKMIVVVMFQFVDWSICFFHVLILLLFSEAFLNAFEFCRKSHLFWWFAAFIFVVV